MHFPIGQYLISIDGEQQLATFIPDKWLALAQSAQEISENIDLHLKTDPSLKEKHFNDGWSAWYSKEGRKIVFAQDGMAVFSMQYSALKDGITVCTDGTKKSQIKLGIQYGIMLALHQKSIGLHGVTLLCGNEIIILSAPSGTGKTTLAKLLEQYCDAVVVNGDFALLSPMEEGLIFEPTPFCGTSGRALNHRFRVNRVVFLSQSEKNEWRELDGREAMTWFMSNAFIPTWDSKLQQAVQMNILKGISAVRVNAFAFAPNQEAAEEFLKHIEK